MPFTPEHHDFRRLVREFVESEINPRVPDWEREEWIPLHDVLGQMAELGLIGLEYDPAYGGQGADHLFTLILAEELGRADHGSIGMAVGVVSDQQAALGLARWPFGLEPGTPEWLGPIVSILVGQLHAMYLTRARGLDPERPRNLNKVTRTR